MSWGVQWGWLEFVRAVAQGYNYNYNEIELGSNFRKNLKSWGVKLCRGLDGCARWRKVTVTVAIQFNLVIIFKII